MDFTLKEEKQLIKLVSEQPCIYNKIDKSYKNQYRREIIWRNIGLEMNKDDNVCKNRWRNIKDTYLRQKRKVARGKHPLNAFPQNPRCKYRLYSKVLRFLDNVGTKTDSADGLVDEEETVEQDDEFSAQEVEEDEHHENITTLKVEYHEQSDDSFSQDNEYISPCSEPLITTSSQPFSTDTEQPPQNGYNIPMRDEANQILAYLKKRDEERQRLSQKAACNNTDELGSFSTHIKTVLMKLPPLLRVRAKQDLFEVLTKYEVMAVDPLQLPEPSGSGSSKRESTNQSS